MFLLPRQQKSFFLKCTPKIPAFLLLLPHLPGEASAAGGAGPSQAGDGGGEAPTAAAQGLHTEDVSFHLQSRHPDVRSQKATSVTLSHSGFSTLCFIFIHPCCKVRGRSSSGWNQILCQCLCCRRSIVFPSFPRWRSHFLLHFVAQPGVTFLGSWRTFVRVVIECTALQFVTILFPPATNV